MKRKAVDMQMLLCAEVKIAEVNNNFSQTTWENIKSYLEQGANLYCRVGKYDTQLLALAIHYVNNDFIDYLLGRADFDINGWDMNPLDNVIGRMVALGEKKEIIDICEKLLQHGANPNGARCPLEPPLIRIVKCGNNELLKLLIKYKADVNKKDFWSNVPLAHIKRARDDGLEKIKTLCDAGASLCDVNRLGDTVFHVAIKGGFPGKYIETFITHACFDNKKKNELLKQSTIETFLIFNKLRVPVELIFRILSEIEHFYGAPRGLRRELVKKGYTCSDISAQAKERVERIQDILKCQNKAGKTALQLLQSEYSNSESYVEEVKPLIDGTMLKAHCSDFLQGFPDILVSKPDNLVCRMY